MIGANIVGAILMAIYFAHDPIGNSIRNVSSGVIEISHPKKYFGWQIAVQKIRVGAAVNYLYPRSNVMSPLEFNMFGFHDRTASVCGIVSDLRLDLFRFSAKYYFKNKEDIDAVEILLRRDDMPSVVVLSKGCDYKFNLFLQRRDRLAFQRGVCDCVGQALKTLSILGK